MKQIHIKNFVAFAITVALLFNSKITNAQYNYFAGTSAGSGNSSWYSTAIGYEALSSGNTGISALAVGYHALKNNTTGYHNVGSGNGALEYNTSGSANTAVGIVCLINNTTGQRNSALGNFALWSNTQGYYNTAIGAEALRTNTTGSNNTSSGYKSLYSNTTGSENCAFGHFASYTSSLAYHNNAFGAYALYYNTGENNCAFGTYVLNSNTTGYFNAAFGHNSLALNATGNNNSAFGKNAGALRAAYDKCTFVGADADAKSNNLSNATAIGYIARVDANNKVRIGNTSVTSIGGQVGWTTSSDLRLKANITESKLGLDFILQLNPVTYNYKDEGQKDILYTGLIAQEVDAAAKKEGMEFSGVDKNGEYWGIRYGDLTVPLIKAVQQMNEELKMKNEKLEIEIAAIKEALSTEQKQRLNSSIQLQENKLEQNNPNPFNQSTVIRYQLFSSEANTKIIIRDLNGNLVKQVSIAQSGKGQVTINANELAQGTYTYTLEVNGASVDTKLMVLVK